MHRGNAAEWILRRVVNSDRASELVGDQLEADAEAGMFKFWLSIACLVFVFSWRTLAGLIAALLVGVFFAWEPFGFVMSKLTLADHRPSVSMLFTLALLGMSMLLWAQAGFSFVRFGFRSELSKLSITAALLGTTAACFWWLPYAPAVLLIFSACILSFHLTNATRRQALVVWITSITLAWITARVVLSIRMSRQHMLAKWPLVLMLMLVPIVEASTSLFLLARFHKGRKKQSIELAG